MMISYLTVKYNPSWV